MNSQQLISMMEHPGRLGKDAGAQLDELIRVFPWFQTAQLLYIKSLHNENSFLYNNRLKVAAAYATNRKVLYDLITQKESAAVEEMISVVESVNGHVEQVIVPEEQTSVEETNSKEPEIIRQPEFPQKRFVKNPDEWEAGMLRQLQLLHHWKSAPEAPAPIAEEKKAEEPDTVKHTEEQKQEEPTAAEEINTLLYVLVEPGQAEDLPAEELTEVPEEQVESNKDIAEPEQNWEIQLIDEITEQDLTTIEGSEETSEKIPVPEDPVEQEIILGAINSSISLEVDEEKETLPEPTEEVQQKPEHSEVIEQINESLQTSSFDNTELSEENPEELSFSGWLKKVSAAPKEIPAQETASEKSDLLPEKKEINADSLIEKFIQEEPRIKAPKPGFYNPVNMAKKSVQESDDFITETLARIYAKQGNIPKAIRTYQKLSLKFPEKSSYFAALIEELKRTPNKK